MLKLSIIITTRNTRAIVLDCLRSIRRFPATCSSELIVVDDGSTDGTAEAIGREFPEVALLINERVLGFAGANNRGMRLAKGEYFLLLNSDTIVQQGALDVMVRNLDSCAKVGMVECQLMNADRTLQFTVGPIPNHLTVLVQALGLRHMVPRRFFPRLARLLTGSGVPRTFQLYFRSFHPSAEKQLKVLDLDGGAYLTGACLMIRRACLWGVGLLDENFPIYTEDADLCLRAHRAGWKLRLIPGPEIIHLGGMSTGPSFRETSPLAHRSTLYFFWKHRGKASFLLAKVLILFGLIRLMIWGSMARTQTLSWRAGTQVVRSLWSVWSFPPPQEPSLVRASAEVAGPAGEAERAGEGPHYVRNTAH